MEFSVTYSKSCVEIEEAFLPICSADVDNLRVGLRELFNSGKETDFTFESKEIVQAHKAVLVAFSSYFEKPISSEGMIETQTNYVKIEESDPDIFCRVFKARHPTRKPIGKKIFFAYHLVMPLNCQKQREKS